ncbi:hypothetical protein FIBSPDRAFT_900789 [Athelia psychrophila]|uniref:Uncharacterized protein n=1 Tax=Athelia psychrophila TaxID=1759441 RepID=A0A165Y0D6_9AGAM|nr:hypothetical protein FIBSPDRAFT_900789 [Fibularhizoctonia sp. CBS 109695]
MLTSLGPHNEPDIWCPSGTPAGPLPPVLFQPLLSEEDIQAMNVMDEDGREHYLEQLRVAAKDCVAERGLNGGHANLQALDEKNTQSRALQEKLRALLHKQAANPVATSSESQDIGLAGNMEPINTQDGEALGNTEQQHSQEDHTLGFEDIVDQTHMDNTEEISVGTKCGAGAMSPLQLTAKSKHKFNPKLGPELGSSPVVLTLLKDLQLSAVPVCHNCGWQAQEWPGDGPGQPPESPVPVAMGTQFKDGFQIQILQKITLLVI